MISAAFPYRKQRRRVLGREMAHVEVGEGDPIVLLHGNPTSSYLWRNVLPHLQPRGRCIAPDLIGMGDSHKLAASGPGAYTFAEHRRYLDALLAALGVTSDVTFVVHDWGSALGFDWANRHRDAVRGIAYMEAITQPVAWDQWSQPCGRTIASMNAMPCTASRWRLAQSKPSAEPQSWMMKVTRSRTFRASSRASR